MANLQAELLALRAELAEEKLESATWRAKARDKGACARRLSEQMRGLVDALERIIDPNDGEFHKIIATDALRALDG